MPVSELPDQFMQAIRQALEHIDDDEWLQSSSPLATIYLASATPAAMRAPQLGLTGQKTLDDQLRAIWHEWEARPKLPLQKLLWDAVCRLPRGPEQNEQIILLLTYFAAPKPKQSAVVKALAVSRATYYRRLEQAIDHLGAVVIQRLHPSLRLEAPLARPLVGRNDLVAAASALLRQGQVVHLVGGSGLGKTTLGAHLAATWGEARVFWYTFRPPLNDHVEQLLFSLGYFLHQQGASNLWLQLTVGQRGVDVSSALSLLRQSLLDLSATPPLFCFDEVDLLLDSAESDGAPDASDRNDAHRQVRLVLEALVQAPRQGAAMLFIGQKLLLEPEPGHAFSVERLDAAAAHTLLWQAGVQLATDEEARLLSYTRGNPLLLRLFATWQRMAGKGRDLLAQLTTDVAFDWFLARIRQHLNQREERLLQEIAVYPQAAPRAAWAGQRKALENLLQLNLVESYEPAGVLLHPALRTALLQSLPDEQRWELHLSAAQSCSQRGEFTTAAYHYIQGQQPAMALWTWHRHRESEIFQGQGESALAIFRALGQTPFTHAADQQLFSLLLAELYSRVNQPVAGLQALGQVAWSPRQPITALAHEWRGRLLFHQGEIDQALAQYRQSIALVEQLRADHIPALRITSGRYQIHHLRNVEQARQEVARARYDLAILQGEIEIVTGNQQAARTHYQAALAQAEVDQNPYNLAKLHEGLGVLHAYQAEVDEAIAHLQQAGDHYRSYGNLTCAVGVTNTNIAYAYLAARRYAEAVPPAETALAFYANLQAPYWLALNEANLAEAHCYLGDLALAESYAQRALRQEEIAVRPYALYILGQIRRRQGQLAVAESFCQQAIASAEENQDRWALGSAWRALGECYRDGGKLAAAEAAFREVQAIYERLDVATELAHSRALLAEVVAANAQSPASATWPPTSPPVRLSTI